MTSIYSFQSQLTEYEIIGIGLVKISVCLCVLRVIDRVGKMLSRFLWVIIIFVSLSHLAQVCRETARRRPECSDH